MRKIVLKDWQENEMNMLGAKISGYESYTKLLLEGIYNDVGINHIEYMVLTI